MNPNLATIKAGLERVEATNKRRAQLESERVELITKIERLTAEVSSGNAKLVPDLTIAKARLESGLPADLKRCDADRAAVVSGLRSVLYEVGPLVARAYGNKFQSTSDEVDAFLTKHLEAGHDRDEILRSIVNGSGPVRKLDGLRSIFHSSALINSMSDNSVINRCHQAVEQLEDVI